MPEDSDQLFSPPPAPAPAPAPTPEDIAKEKAALKVAEQLRRDALASTLATAATKLKGSANGVDEDQDDPLFWGSRLLQTLQLVCDALVERQMSGDDSDGVVTVFIPSSGASRYIFTVPRLGDFIVHTLLAHHHAIKLVLGRSWVVRSDVTRFSLAQGTLVSAPSNPPRPCPLLLLTGAHKVHVPHTGLPPHRRGDPVQC